MNSTTRGPQVVFEPSEAQKEHIETLASNAHMATASFARMMIKLALNERSKGRNS